MKKYLFLILFLSNEIANGQSANQNLLFYPTLPKAGDSVLLAYNASSSGLIYDNQLKCIVYISNGGEEPRAITVNLLKHKNWSEKIIIPPNTLSLHVIVKDSVSGVDNNSGEGYWSTIYKNGKVVPEALASVAYMYSSGWSPNLFHLESKPGLARSLFEEEFKANNTIKRKYWRWYLNTLSSVGASDVFNRELKAYAISDSLTEWDLLAIINYYQARKDTQSAEKYNKMLFATYPKGNWATQQASSNYVKKFLDTNDDSERERYFIEYKNKFSDVSAPDIIRYINSTKATIYLRRLIVHYINQNKLIEWEREADELNSTDIKAVLYEMVSEIFLKQKQYIPIAELLSKKAVDISKNNLTSPRIVTERLFRTDEDVKLDRESKLGGIMGIYGYSLLLQDKVCDALPVLKEAALTYGKRKDIVLNQYYIEVLLKSKKIDAALDEVEECSRIGKSSDQINDLIKNYLTSPGKLNELKKKSIQTAEKQIEKQLISESISGVFFTNEEGRKIDLEEFAGKTIILDFWATWCTPCIAGFDAMQKVVGHYQREKDVVFLFINTQERDDKGRQRAKELFKTRKYPFILLFDDYNKSTKEARVSALPTKLIIDKSGKVRFRSVGLTGTVDEQVAEISAMIQLIR